MKDVDSRVYKDVTEGRTDAIFPLYHGDQFKWWKKPEYLERTTDHGQATGKLIHLWLQVECTLFFSSPVQSTGSELMSSPVGRRPMLTFAFSSNVDKLLDPG